MKINGFQKLTLLDYPGKTACTVFTGGCNLRCPFCHNGGLVLSPAETPVISEDEFFAVLEKRKNIIEGVCITGGEPLLQKDLPDFLEKIKSMGFSVKIDTNGCYPKALKYIVYNGLADYVAMDIKNCKEKYALTAGVNGLDISRIEESVDFLKTGKVSHEFRTTVTKTFHNKNDLLSIARWLGGGEKYFLQNFKDSPSLINGSTKGYTPAEMNDFLECVRKIIPQAELRGI